MMICITAYFLKHEANQYVTENMENREKPEGRFPFYFWYLNATVITEYCKESDKLLLNYLVNCSGLQSILNKIYALLWFIQDYRNSE